MGYPNRHPSQSILNRVTGLFVIFPSTHIYFNIILLMSLFFGKTLISVKILIFSSSFLFWRLNTLSLLKLVEVAIYKLLIRVRYLWKKYEGTKNKNFWNLVGQNEHKYIRYIEIFRTYSFYLLSHILVVLYFLWKLFAECQYLLNFWGFLFKICLRWRNTCPILFKTL